MGKRKVFSSQKGRVLTKGTSGLVSGVVMLAFCVWCYGTCGDDESSGDESAARDELNSVVAPSPDVILVDDAFEKFSALFERDFNEARETCNAKKGEAWFDVCLLALHKAAKTYSQFQGVSNSPQKERVANEAGERFSAYQSKIYPTLRDRVGPVLRALMKKHGLDVRTTGDSFKTFRITSKTSTSQALCGAPYKELEYLVVQLRFDQVECVGSDAKATAPVDSVPDGDISSWISSESRYESNE